MAADEYSTGGGGKLKLKGNKVSDGRVKKKKKSSSSKKKTAGESEPATESGSDVRDSHQHKRESAEREQDRDGDGDAGTQTPQSAPAKTEAERKYEEVRRKRVCVSLDLGCLASLTILLRIATGSPSAGGN